MPSVPHFPNRQARAAASVVLVLATVLVLIVEHVTVSAAVGEARTPEMAVSASSGSVPRAVQYGSAQVAVAQPTVASTGPGGAQPWVRWSYIP